MGLDMMLYRCKKPSYSENTSYFQNKDVDNNPNMYCETFRKFAELTKKVNKYWDLEKINQTFGVKVKYNSSTCAEGYGFQCEDIVPEEYRRSKNDMLFGGDKQLFIKNEDISNFLIDKEDKMYAIDFEEIDYQRKGLNDKGWDLIPENVSYTDKKTQIKKMTQGGGLSKSFINNWIDGETVFHPWW